MAAGIPTIHYLLAHYLRYIYNSLALFLRKWLMPNGYGGFGLPLYRKQQQQDEYYAPEGEMQYYNDDSINNPYEQGGDATDASLEEVIHFGDQSSPPVNF